MEGDVAGKNLTHGLCIRVPKVIHQLTLRHNFHALVARFCRGTRVHVTFVMPVVAVIVEVVQLDAFLSRRRLAQVKDQSQVGSLFFGVAKNLLSRTGVNARKNANRFVLTCRQTSETFVTSEGQVLDGNSLCSLCGVERSIFSLEQMRIGRIGHVERPSAVRQFLHF